MVTQSDLLLNHSLLFLFSFLVPFPLPRLLPPSASPSYGSTIHGLSALQTAFLVAFTQLIPEHQLQLFSGLIKIRVKRLPGVYLLVSNVLTLLVNQNPYIIIQFGFFSGWVYLRFVKVQEGSGGEFRGDRSETFAFTSWFPPIAQ
jgi:hypothetical protein